MRLLSSALSVLSLAALAACSAPSSTVPASTPVLGAGPAAKTTTASGIVIETLQAGSGASPKASDTVKVHYRGTLTDGSEFDSSYKRGQPASFPLNGVIPCWTEAVQTMKVGGKARITCPSALAYGPRGAGGGKIPPNSTLVFEVELISIGS
jgi:FKBP-type peptidyl-prolyl cis-trans isomerase FkpA